MVDPKRPPKPSSHIQPNFRAPPPTHPTSEEEVSTPVLVRGGLSMGLIKEQLEGLTTEEEGVTRKVN